MKVTLSAAIFSEVSLTQARIIAIDIGKVMQPIDAKPLTPQHVVEELVLPVLMVDVGTRADCYRQ